MRNTTRRFRRFLVRVTQWRSIPALLVAAAVPLCTYMALWGAPPPGQGHRDTAEKAKTGDDPVRQHPNEDYNVSIVQLLAHREHYHGKRVQVEGFMTIAFESDAIYLSADDAQHGLTGNGFWVTFAEQLLPDRPWLQPPFDRRWLQAQFDRKYVLVEGVFNKDCRGHHSLWQGSIEDIDRVIVKDAQWHD